jgi:hypothetical protein
MHGIKASKIKTILQIHNLHFLDKRIEEHTIPIGIHTDWYVKGPQ